MTLNNIFSSLRQSQEYGGLFKSLTNEPGDIHATILSQALPYCIGALRTDLNVPILIVLDRPERANKVYEDLSVWCGDNEEVYQFPELGLLPYERVVSDHTITHERLKILSVLSNRNYPTTALPPIIVTSLESISQKTLTVNQFRSSCRQIKVGDTAEPQELLGFLQKTGYRTARLVDTHGLISRRGGIIDVYPTAAIHPYRIEFFGSTVESIRLFDPVSQLSLQQIENIFIPPAEECLPSIVDKQEIENLHKQLDMDNCSEMEQLRIANDLSMAVEGYNLDEPAFYQGFFCNGSLLDFLDAETLLVLENPSDLENERIRIDEKSTELRLMKELSGVIPRQFPSIHLSGEELDDRIASMTHKLNVTPWLADQTISNSKDHDLTFEIGFTPPKSYSGRFDVLAKDIHGWLGKGDSVLIVSHHSSRIIEILQGQNIPSKLEPSIAKAVLENGNHGNRAILIKTSLEEGWDIEIGNQTIHLLTDSEIIGHSKKRATRKSTTSNKPASLSDLETGSYVVHIEHGIGRFIGTQHMNVDGGEREYLTLEYADSDRLYVPTDHLDRISLYSSSGERKPILTRLGTQEWTRAKDKTRASTKKLAIDLLSIYADREILEGIPFPPDTPWQTEMEDSFPFEETPDQLITIQDVKLDMENSKPMDRLICGDVGYGKTEIALRAAFKAVMAGTQVAILVPTTILSQQHYSTFLQRLSSFPVKIAVLSRLRSPEEQQAVISDLTEGKIDICIGTHRLLQKDVRFKNLGLVVVDEEQRFGVGHKERLKDMRREADILTLSATPIPRTLHMALSGIRDMSTIETSPEQRLSIKTYVSEYSEQLIREAILREIDRGGQAFFLHNRVRTITEISEKLRSLVPEASIAIAHGQMKEDELEHVMANFSTGAQDVLVCTTIIEAGLDLPNVNTLIIDRADSFGLAQLYQLRGRIGRGTNRAYAYLMTPKHKQVTEVAEKRLKTILAANELGAGFRIAMKDLEIRGAGNLLGPEQSGHINAVGYELYSQMLSEAIEELRAERQGNNTANAKTNPDVNVSLPLSAYVPVNYISDLTIRLGFYRRLAKYMNRDDLKAIKDELVDRFGPLPNQVADLLYVVEMKSLAHSAGITSITQDGTTGIIQFEEPISGARLPIQKALGGTATVGNTQVRLPLKTNWKENLLQTIDKIASLKIQLLSLVEGKDRIESEYDP